MAVTEVFLRLFYVHVPPVSIGSCVEYYAVQRNGCTRQSAACRTIRRLTENIRGGCLIMCITRPAVRGCCGEGDNYSLRNAGRRESARRVTARLRGRGASAGEGWSRAG